MEFTSADPSVVRSVKQRELLDTWRRARRKPLPLPVIGDYQPERIADDQQFSIGIFLFQPFQKFNELGGVVAVL